LLVVAGAGFSVWGIVHVFQWVHPALSSLAAVFFAYTTLATRNLYDEVKKVTSLLEEGDLAGARRRVGSLVSRDTDHLDEQGIGRALIETVSETPPMDHGPLTHLSIGTFSGNSLQGSHTLDSMVGYKNEEYRFLLSWHGPMTWPTLSCTSASYMFSPPSSWERMERAWRIAWRDGRKNTGQQWISGSLAGRRIQLGEKNVYFGRRWKNLMAKTKNPSV
jgi:adenosylcobinamide-phosphate synthase